jgi:hypothetical protein
MRNLIKYILVFIAQVVVLNHLDFATYLKPQLFILILINLPPYLNKSVQMLLGFGLGLAADLFVSTPGIHASACMILILARFAFINRYEMEEVIANRDSLGINNTGLSKYLVLSGILVLVYHLYVFGLESLGAVNYVNYLLTVIISSITTYSLILLLQFLYSAD